MKKKIFMWKINCLTPAGRLILAHDTLNDILAYSMQYFCLPAKTNNMIDKIQRDFIWGSTSHKRKIHYVVWKIIVSPKNMVVLVSNQPTLKIKSC